MLDIDKYLDAQRITPYLVDHADDKTFLFDLIGLNGVLVLEDLAYIHLVSRYQYINEA